MRMRNIKPGFFVNYKLSELHPLTRLLYAGLWCVADRNGRLENTPMRLKIQILPYDSHDIAEALESLESAGFITQYSAGGMELIEISNFKRHQHISVREMEAKTTLPGPGASDPEEKQEAKPKDATAATVDPEADSRSNIIIGIWNEMAEKHGLKSACTDTDRKAARVLAKIADGEQIVRAINSIADSPFLRGEGEKGWAANLDWLGKAGNLDKVLSGQYADHKQSAKKKQTLEYLRPNNNKTGKYVGVCDNCDSSHEIMADPKIAMNHTTRVCECGKRVKLDIVLEEANA